MITINIHLRGRLKNGQIGTVKYIKINKIKYNISIANEDVTAGLIRINGNNLFVRTNKWVPIKKEEYQYS